MFQSVLTQLFIFLKEFISLSTELELCIGYVGQRDLNFNNGLIRACSGCRTCTIALGSRAKWPS